MENKPWYKPSEDYDTHREVLETYAADHDGWTFHQRNGSAYVGRIYEVASGKRVLVSIGCDERSLDRPARRRSPKPSQPGKSGNFRAYLNVAFSAGPIDETRGSIEECDAWVTRYVKVLGIANEILSATTMAKAAELLSKLAPREVYVICDAIDLPISGTTTEASQRLLETSKAHSLPPARLKQFADDRRYWSLAEQKDGRWYAWRVVEVLDTVYHLRVMPSWDNSHSDSGWLAMAVTGDALEVARYDGSASEVIDEISQLEKTLDLVEQLRACKTRLQAKALLENVRGQQLDMLRRACGTGAGSAENVRNAISLMTCGIGLELEPGTNGKW